MLSQFPKPKNTSTTTKDRIGDRPSIGNFRTVTHITSMDHDSKVPRYNILK